MTNEEILKFQKRAKHVATKRGYPELADDFSQEIFIAFARGWRSTIEQLFSSYLRSEHGDPRHPAGLARRLAQNRTMSFDGPVNENEGSPLLSELIGDGEPCERNSKIYTGNDFNLTGAQDQLYKLYFVDGLRLKDIAELFGVTESAVSIRMKPIKSQIKEEIELTQVWEQYVEEPNYSKLHIDWIRI